MNSKLVVQSFPVIALNYLRWILESPTRWSFTEIRSIGQKYTACNSWRRWMAQSGEVKRMSYREAKMTDVMNCREKVLAFSLFSKSESNIVRFYSRVRGPSALKIANDALEMSKMVEHPVNCMQCLNSW